MNEPLLSVVVITYNQENYIAQTLDSIIEQEHNYPYEIIVGEDCSTDGTRDVLLRYKEKYPDIIKLLLNEKNLGLIKNYFNTVAHCTGKYIMGCAGDDYWLPGKVKTQIEFMERNLDVGACCGNAQRLYSNGKMRQSNYSEELIKFETIFKKGNIVVAPTFCIRGELLLEYIKTVDPLGKNWLMEDLPIMLYISYYSKLYCLKDVMVVYRVIENSLSRQRDYGKRKKMDESSLEIRRFFSDLIGDLSYWKEGEKLIYGSLAKTALMHKQREDYNEYVAKIHDATFFSKYAGKYQWSFYLYCYGRNTIIFFKKGCMAILSRLRSLLSL